MLRRSASRLHRQLARQVLHRQLHRTARREVVPLIVAGLGVFAAAQALRYVRSAQARLEAKERVERRVRNGLPLEQEDVDLLGEDTLRTMGVPGYADPSAESPLADAASAAAASAMAYPVFGIDIGPTALKVSIAESGERGAEVLENAEGARSTPSVLFVPPGESSPVVGAMAQQQLWQAPGTSLLGVPLLLAAAGGSGGIGDAEDILGASNAAALAPFGADGAGDDGFVARLGDAEITGGGAWRILASQGQEIFHRRSDTIGLRVMAHPSHADSAPFLAEDGDEDGGGGKSVLCGESIAAAAHAIAEGLLPPPEDWTGDVLIADCGGASASYGLLGAGCAGEGEGDGALVAEKLGLDLKASAVRLGSGGMSVDAALVEKLDKDFAKANPGLDLTSDGACHQRVRDAVEAAKVELTSKPRSHIQLPFVTADATGPKHLDQALSQTDLERAAFKQLDAMVHGLKAFVKEHAVERPHALLLVGGCARMPLLKERFQRYAKELGAELVTPQAPEDAVVLGAAEIGKRLLDA